MTAKQQRFLKAGLAEQVRLASPAARDAVLLGIEIDLNAYDTETETLMSRVESLIGHDGPACVDTETHKLEELAAGAYTLGIAVGLLLRPDAFTVKGGAR